MNRSMLSWVCLVTFVTLPYLVSAQFEVEELVTVPKTPEAAAFTEYANTASVSLYSGKASVSVPIDGLQGRNMSHPVSLTYMTGGIKVQQEAGVAGLGWNLNVGGMVTRNINGLPDDYSSGDNSYYPFYSEKILQWFEGGPTPTVFDAYKEFRDRDYGIYVNGIDVGKTYEGSYQSFDANKWHELYYHFIQRNDLELQPDTYSFSAGGISGTLAINYEDGTAYCIEHPDYLVDVIFGPTGAVKGQKPINGWDIRDNQGTLYEFRAKESTRVGGDDQQGRPAFRYRTYTSGWYLTRKYNELSTDEYIFSYNEYTTSEYSMPGHATTISGRYPQGDDSDQYCGTGTTINDPGTVDYLYTKNRLNNVRINGVTRLQLLYDANRLDLSSESLLDGVYVYNVLGDQINAFDFIYSYFGDTDSGSDYTSRLRLDEVWILGDGTSIEKQKYKFEYDNQALPDRDSFAQDYWGYYNGFTENQGLVPRNDLLTNPAEHTGNRSVIASKMQAGVLEKVIYPTGGSTEFEYTSNGYHGLNTNEAIEYVGRFDFVGGSNPQENDPCNPQDGINGAPYVMEDAMVIMEEDIYTIKIEATGGTIDAVQGAAIRLLNFTQCEATNPSDPDSFDFLQFNPDEFGEAHQVTTTLTPGKYKVMLVNDQANTILSLRVSRTVADQQHVTIPVGGLRVISKQEFDEAGISAGRTLYRYYDVTSENDNVSGVLHHRPSFENTNSSEVIHNTLPVACESVTRSASNQNTPTPNIVTYSTVSEMRVDGDGNPNGVTVFQFHNDNEGVGSRPFAKSKLKNGMPESKKVYKAELVDEVWTYEVLVEEFSDYYIKPLGGMVAYSFESRASAYLDPMLHENPENPIEAKWVYAPMYITSLGLSGGSSYTSVETITLVKSFFLFTGGYAHSSLAIHQATESGTEGVSGENHLAPCSFNHNHNRTTDVNESNLKEDIFGAVSLSNPIAAGLIAADDFVMNLLNSSPQDFSGVLEYDPYLIECFPQPAQTPITYKQPYLIPRSWLQNVSTTTIQYEGDAEIRTVRTYAYDETDDTNQFQVLTVNNQYPHGKTESIHYSYATDNPTEDTGLAALIAQNRVAEPYQVARKVDDVEKSIKLTLYDNEGRPETIQVAHDSPEIAIGDLSSYLEDQVVILEYDESFNKIKKLKDRSGLINYYLWTDDGQSVRLHLQIDQPDFESGLPGNSGNEDHLKGLFDRYSSLPNSIVTAYDYDTGKGVSRQIDPNGRNTYFEYDSFGRLLKVLDHEGHVLSQNEYHFANQNN